MKKLNVLLVALVLTAAAVGYAASKAPAHSVKAQECGKDCTGCTGGSCCASGSCTK
jgi:hypothetical protein